MEDSEVISEEILSGCRLFVIGSASFGSSGLPEHEITESFLGATKVQLDGQEVDCVSSSYRHSLMADSRGNVWAWGYTKYGRLGLGDRIGEFAVWTPQMIPFSPGTCVSVVSCGYGHSAAVSSRGILFTWGYSVDGQLGLGPEATRQRICRPRRVQAIGAVSAVSCGPTHTLVLSPDGRVSSAGKLADATVRKSDEFHQWQRNDTIYYIYASHKLCLLVSRERPNGFYQFGPSSQGSTFHPVCARESSLSCVKNAERYTAALDVDGNLYVCSLHSSCEGQIGQWRSVRPNVASLACGPLSLLIVTDDGLVESCSNLRELQPVHLPGPIHATRVQGSHRTFFITASERYTATNQDPMMNLRGQCNSEQCVSQCHMFAGMSEGVGLNSGSALSCLRCGCIYSQHECLREAGGGRQSLPQEIQMPMATKEIPPTKPTKQTKPAQVLTTKTLPHHISLTEIVKNQSRCVNISVLDETKMRVYCVSDIHTDFKGNMKWLKEFIESVGDEHQNDILIIAGDVSHVKKILEETFELFLSAFGYVFHICGNHELWVSPKTDEIQDGYDKLLMIQNMCDRLGVFSHTVIFNGTLAVVPMLSWYNPQFDGKQNRQTMTGFDCACRWEQSDDEIAKQMMRCNRAAFEELKRYQPEHVISFSHFLPRRELYWGIRGMGEVMGSTYIEKALRELGSFVHVFGHSHLNADETIAGVRYVQHALGSSKFQRTNSLFPQYLPKRIF